MTSPLAATFGQMAQRKDELYLFARLGNPPRDEEWTPMSQLATDGELVAGQVRLVREKWSLDNRGSALAVVGALAWQLCGAALFVYATDRRVPDLSPENIKLRLVGGNLEEVAFTSDRFAALAGDAASESASVLFEDSDTLRDYLREGMERLLSPVVDHIRAATRVSKRTLWNRASDLVGGRLLQFGGVTGDKLWCGREADKLLHEPGSPFNGPTEFFTVEHEGREEFFMTWGCCCHAYKNPEYGHCATCPLLPRHERERLAVERMAG